MPARYTTSCRRLRTAERYCGKARILIETQKFDEARELLEEALAKLPDDVPVLNTLGILFNHTGDYYEALRYFDRAHAVHPHDNPSRLFNKVFSLRNLGYYEEEHKLLLELLEGDPDNTDFIAELAYCEGQRSNYREAVEGCKKALESGYETPQLYTWLCKAYLKLDFMHELFAALQGVSKFPDQNAELYTFLGMAHMKLEQYEDARRVFEQGLAVDPEAEGIPELIALVEQVPRQRLTRGQRRIARAEDLNKGGLS